MSGPRTQHREVHDYNQHRKKVENATSKVDNSAPKLSIRIYTNGAKLYEDAFRLQQIENQNRNLLKMINYINRTKGKVDCYHTKPIVITSKNRLRELQQKEYETKNTAILKTLTKKLGPSPYSQTVLEMDWKQNLKSMISSSRFPDFYKKKVTPLNTWSICPPELKTDPSKRKTCFFDISAGGVQGRMYIEIYADVVPISAQNFISFCEGWNNYSYKNTLFYWIVPGMFCVGGDVLKFIGIDGTSIYPNNFVNENYLLQHNGPGVVAMYSSNQGLNHSQFLITFKKLPIYNGRFVVIGRVVKNLNPLYMIEEFGTKSGNPLAKVVIQNCGVC